jgi:tetratricopeptide (TPR) repeat protein
MNKETPMRHRLVILFTILSLAGSLAAFAADKPAPKKEAQTKESAKMEELIEKGEFQKAVEKGKEFIEAYTKAGKIEELPKEFWINLSTAYFKLKDFPSALENIEKAAAKDMFDVKVLQYKAGVLHEMKQDDKVAETYQTILSLDPGNLEVKYGLARILEEQKKTDEAVKLYDEIIAAKPDYNDVAYDVGILYFQKGDYAKSQEYLDKANKATPGKEGILLALGQTLLKGQKYKEAIPVIQEYLKVSTKDTYKIAAAKNLGLCLMKEKSYEEAIKAYDEVLKQKPSDETSLLNKAQCQIELKKNAEAVTTLEAYLAVTKNEEKKKEITDLVKTLKGGGGKKGK